MKKDAIYYENRLKEKADKIYAEETTGMTIEEVLDQKLDVYENINVISFLNRIGFNFPEARAIITCMKNHASDTDYNKSYELTWVSISSANMPYGGEVTTEKMTKSEMIERLEWISNENFGQDIDEWLNWLEAFEKDTPPAYSR